MSQIITNRVRTSRRALLKGITAAGARIAIGLPPLVSMFNSTGTAYAAARAQRRRIPADPAVEKPIESRFVLWFNGNGIPERYWIPSEEGADYELTPCLAPLAAWRKDVHVLSGVDNAAASGKGNGHTNSMSGLMTGTDFTGRGPSGPSIDQIIAAKIGGDSRFRSLQIGVAQESFGESMQRNMSWAGYERALPPEMIPHRLFDRLFGAQRRGLGQSEAEHSGYGDGGRHGARRRSCRGRQDARGRASVGHSRSGARDCRAAARSTARGSAGFRRRYEGLAAHCEAAERSAGAGARDASDARCFLHADEVPEL